MTATAENLLAHGRVLLRELDTALEALHRQIDQAPALLPPALEADVADVDAVLTTLAADLVNKRTSLFLHKHRVDESRLTTQQLGAS
jgi:hypothetical protein